MGNLFSKIEDWITYPWKNNIPLGVMLSWGVILLIVILWMTDSLSLLKKMASDTTKAIP